MSPGHSAKKVRSLLKDCRATMAWDHISARKDEDAKNGLGSRSVEMTFDVRVT
jgi:hypothetical protein